MLSFGKTPRYLVPRSRLWAVLLTAALIAVVAAGIASTLTAQDIVLRGTKGETLRESDLAQAGVSVVVVWASWSPRGRDVVDRVNAIAGRWSPRARVVTVNFQEDRATIDQFLGSQPLGVPVFMDADGAFAKKHAITALPGLLIFKDGQTSFRGRLPDDPDRLIGEILQ